MSETITKQVRVYPEREKVNGKVYEYGIVKVRVDKSLIGKKVKVRIELLE